MKINVFVIREADVFWIAGAWDEYTMDANYEGYQEEEERLHKVYGNNFRVAQIVVSDSFMDDAFSMHVEEAQDGTN